MRHQHILKSLFSKVGQNLHVYTKCLEPSIPETFGFYSENISL